MILNHVKVHCQEVLENKAVLDLLTLKEKSYYNIDENGLSELEYNLLNIDFFGIAISAPEKIDVETREILPLVVGIRYSGDRGWDFPLKENCFIVVTNLSDGSEFKSRLFQDKKRKIPVEDEEEKQEKPTGLAMAAAVVTIVNVRDLLELPWSTGKWSFSVSYYDWESNKVEVTFEGDDVVKNYHH